MANDATTTIADLRETMRVWVSERHWQKYHRPKNLAASVCIEAGELLEMFQWLTPEEVDQRMTDEKFREAVGEEMCDVLMYVIGLANAMDLDLADAVEKKMKKNAIKYPRDTQWRPR